MLKLIVTRSEPSDDDAAWLEDLGDSRRRLELAARDWARTIAACGADYDRVLAENVHAVRLVHDAFVHVALSAPGAATLRPTPARPRLIRGGRS